MRKISRSRKKVALIATSLILVVGFIVGTVIAVFAATQQAVNTAINVTYTSKEVAGTVTASYQVKNKNYLSITFVFANLSPNLSLLSKTKSASTGQIRIVMFLIMRLNNDALLPFKSTTLIFIILLPML